ncbi:MAG: hypothetical protein K8H87_03835 [Pseudorhodoplanes sp.]|nr:hypothetical protein [Pseudorhodoplanes sp.]
MRLPRELLSFFLRTLATVLSVSSGIEKVTAIPLLANARAPARLSSDSPAPALTTTRPESGTVSGIYTKRV